MLKRLLFILTFSSTLWLHAANAAAPYAATAQDKYFYNTQVISCPRDAKQYGNFHDYGYWKGGSWCGQTGKAGYWVWLNPNWYVWRYQIPAQAHYNHQYSHLKQIVKCPTDAGKYGKRHNYGYWKGGAWCGTTGKSGYWVWVNPYWYVWKQQR